MWPAFARRRLPAVAGLSLASALACAADGAALPRHEHARLAEVAGLIERAYVVPVERRRLAAGCIDGTGPLAAGTPPPKDPAEMADVMPWLHAAARALEGRTPPADLVTACIRGMLGALDARSEYFDALRWRQFRSGSAGGPAAVGVDLTRVGSTVRIVSTLAGSPARAAGLVPGERLLAIDGVATQDLPLEEVARRLRGPPGSSLRLELAGRDGAGRRALTLERRTVRDDGGVQAAWLDSGVIWLRVARLLERTEAAIDAALAELAPPGQPAPSGLVLDLRRNGGGLLTAAIALSALFLEEGAPIGAIEGRTPENNLRFTAQRDAFDARAPQRSGSRAASVQARALLRGLPTAVLVDGDTAVGAEMLAAALRAGPRAILVGHRTRGAGSIQTLFPISPQEAIKLTTGSWRLPGGDRLDGAGLIPDLPAFGPPVEVYDLGTSNDPEPGHAARLLLERNPP